ncbi:putative N-acetylated-alpha-linked acidic dipeptidase isoform X2 [Anabrus simplex]|uniref:putative N-acetylated-alpha-linked acidic dipeptidase isoform X2 n=1 Tax=Anabrus simplex TaxID=316456 RepID=UPI0035A3BEA9
MHRVLSLQTSASSAVPFGFVSKRLCCSAMFTMGLMTFISGFILGRFAWDREQLLKAHSNKPNDWENAVDEVQFIIQETLSSSIQRYLNDLRNSNTGNISSNEYQARLLLKHFTELGFDSVSLKPSTVLLSYYDRNRPNRVSIMDRSKYVESFYNNESAYFSTPEGLNVSCFIEGAVVYINFGQDSDYEYLKKLEINVKDLIVLARLGRVSPVNLVDNALRRGANGVILFADPQQYPHVETRTNPFLWPSHLGLLQILHGSNTTKMNTGGKEASRTYCVPVQVIKPHDAQEILRKMSSSNQSHKSWLGDLQATTYPMGPGFSTQSYRLRMEINTVNVEKKFFNVIAAIRGNKEPDRYVLLGSDREPLVSQSSYPLEGTATMMEFARVLATLRTANNWRPRRTLVFCSWGVAQTGGQFHGVPLNSEWSSLLDSRTVAYFNIDASDQGNSSFIAHGTPVLSKLMYDASSLVPYTSSKASLYDVWLQETVNTTVRKYPIMGAVTSEDDLQTFLHNQGIPSLHFQFAHNEVLSRVNSLEGGLKNHKAAVQLWGMLTWKLADSLILPFDTRQYAVFLVQSVAAIQAKYEKVLSNHMLPIGLLHDTVKNFSEVAETFHKKLAHVDKTNTLEMRIMNDQLLQLERAFLHHSPTRRTRHIVLAPGASISNDASLGFGALQDQLGEISTSPIAMDLRASISDHILSLIHCVKSAISVLDEPLAPITSSDF